MGMRLRSDLGKMRDTQHLMVSAEIPEPRSHNFGHRPSHAGIHFIENKNGHPIALSQNRFQRQHDTGQFPSRSHPGQRLERFTGIGRKHELHRILSCLTIGRVTGQRRYFHSETSAFHTERA